MRKFQPFRRRRALPPHHARGFTLIETSLALVIVGTGVLAALQLSGVCTNASTNAARTTTARMLADNIREAMAGLEFRDPTSGTKWGAEVGEETTASYDDVDDFDGFWVEATKSAPGTTHNPPIDSMRAPIPKLSQYQQVVTVMPVDPNDLSGNSNEASPSLPKGTYTGALRVRVRVQYLTAPGARPIDLYTMSWIRTDD
jgi:prepilin-type N-terminal cleavage/methylation domain-containing protein